MKTFTVVMLAAVLGACGSAEYRVSPVKELQASNSRECVPDKFSYTLQTIRCRPGWVLSNPAYGANSQIGAEQ